VLLKEAAQYLFFFLGAPIMSNEEKTMGLEMRSEYEVLRVLAVMLRDAKACSMGMRRSEIAKAADLQPGKSDGLLFMLEYQGFVQRKLQQVGTAGIREDRYSLSEGVEVKVVRP